MARREKSFRAGRVAVIRASSPWVLEREIQFIVTYYSKVFLNWNELVGELL